MGSELGSKISVTRKFRNGITGRDKWWFLLKGQESVLKELETVWESVSLQTKWKLEACTKPTDVSATPTSESSSTANATPASLNATSGISEPQSSTCNGAVNVPDNRVIVTLDSQSESDSANENFLSEGLVSQTPNN